MLKFHFCPAYKLFRVLIPQHCGNLLRFVRIEQLYIFDSLLFCPILLISHILFPSSLAIATEATTAPVPKKQQIAIAMAIGQEIEKRLSLWLYWVKPFKIDTRKEEF